MKKVIFVLAISTLAQVFAKLPSWYPANLNEILSKCKTDHPVPPELHKQLQNNQLHDSPEVRALLACTYKGMNVFRTGKGFNVKRLADSVNRSSNSLCGYIVARKCVAKYKETQPEDALIFKVLKCVMDAVTKKTQEAACNSKP